MGEQAWPRCGAHRCRVSCLLTTIMGPPQQNLGVSRKPGLWCLRQAGVTVLTDGAHQAPQSQRLGTEVAHFAGGKGASVCGHSAWTLRGWAPLHEGQRGAHVRPIPQNARGQGCLTALGRHGCPLKPTPAGIPLSGGRGPQTRPPCPHRRVEGAERGEQGALGLQAIPKGARVASAKCTWSALSCGPGEPSTLQDQGAESILQGSAGASPDLCNPGAVACRHHRG